MTKREANKLIKQLASANAEQSQAACHELHSFVSEAASRETYSGGHLKILDTIEHGLAELLSDVEGLKARSDTDFADFVTCVIKAMATRVKVAVPALSNVFLTGDPDTSYFAADALALIVFENGNREALDVLVAGSHNECSRSVRLNAVKALGLLGKRGGKIQPALQKLLIDPDMELREAAIVALGKQRETGISAVPELVRMLSQDSELTDYIQWAIEKITGQPSPKTWPRKSRLINEGQAAYDDPIFKEGWSVNMLPQSDKRSEKAAAATEETLTGFDFRANWLEEIRTIHEHGPFTSAEMKELTFQQLIDYYYVTSWILRQEGRESFISNRQELRDLLVRRIERGQRLNPEPPE